jgi:hypothetical protein
MGWACGTHGEMRSAFKILVGKPEGKKPLGRLARRCEDSVKMSFSEIVLEGVYWIYLAHDRDLWWALSSALRMAAVFSSTRRYNPEDLLRHLNHRESRKSHTIVLSSTSTKTCFGTEFSLSYCQLLIKIKRW